MCVRSHGPCSKSPKSAPITRPPLSQSAPRFPPPPPRCTRPFFSKAVVLSCCLYVLSWSPVIPSCSTLCRRKDGPHPLPCTFPFYALSFVLYSIFNNKGEGYPFLNFLLPFSRRSPICLSCPASTPRRSSVSIAKQRKTFYVFLVHWRGGPLGRKRIF